MPAPATFAFFLDSTSVKGYFSRTFVAESNFLPGAEKTAGRWNTKV
jgi:hypothetical protein